MPILKLNHRCYSFQFFPTKEKESDYLVDLPEPYCNKIKGVFEQFKETQDFLNNALDLKRTSAVGLQKPQNLSGLYIPSEQKQNTVVDEPWKETNKRPIIIQKILDGQQPGMETNNKDLAIPDNTGIHVFWGFGCLTIFCIMLVIISSKPKFGVLEKLEDAEYQVDLMRVKYKGWSPHTSHGFFMPIPPPPGMQQQSELTALEGRIKEIKIEIAIEKAASEIRRAAETGENKIKLE